MKIGIVFPQTEIGVDPEGICYFAQAIEDLNFSHLLVYDHVLGADPASHPGWAGPYTHLNSFHEPFVLFGYLASVTKRLELVTGIVILPQRQTALVAKQAAEVDVLSKGRLRLGIGIGWNHVEYEALGENFHNRGKRIEEQINLLRVFWTNEVVDFKGHWHNVNGAGINPMPTQRPIPIWIGGGADAVLRRIAKLGDGWFPQIQPDEAGKAVVQRLRGYIQQEGRDPNTIGIEGRMSLQNSSPESWAQIIEDWQKLGATHLSINTMGAGFRSIEDHIRAVGNLKRTAGIT